MLAAGSCSCCRFVDDAGFSGVHCFSLGGMEVVRKVDSRQLKVESWGTDPTPRLICVNAADKGNGRRFGVKAADKELSGGWRVARNSQIRHAPKNWRGER